jgi:hypothetical protein
MDTGIDPVEPLAGESHGFASLSEAVPIKCAENDRYVWIPVALFGLVYLGLSLLQCGRLPMWTDELFTYFAATQPAILDVIHAIREGCDGQPPLYTLLARFSLNIFGHAAIAIRFPAVLGMGVMCVGLFAFCHRRLRAIEATVAVLIACHASFYFITEGRCYGAVLGCTALALLFWQRATERHSRRAALAGLGLSLAGAMAFHYYSVFLLVPFAVGELVRWKQTRKVDYPVLLAVGVSSLMLLAHLPLITAARPMLAHNWARATPLQAVSFYLEYFGPLIPWCLGSLAIYGLYRLMPDRESVHARTYRGMPKHEWAACAALAALPVSMVITALSTTGVFTSRYGLFAVVGAGAIAAAAISKVSRGNRTIPAILVLTLTIGLELRLAASLTTPMSLREGQAALDVLRQFPGDSRPVLVAHDHVFMELWFYRPELRNRIVHPIDSGLERQYTGSDTSPLLLSALRHRVPMRVPDYREFISSNPKFLLATDGHDWLLTHFVNSGYSVTTVAHGLLAVDASGVATK